MDKEDKKPKEEPKIKPLLSSQVELLGMKMEQLNQVAQVLQQRRTELANMMNTVALELGVPQKQLGEWELSPDGKSLVQTIKIK